MPTIEELNEIFNMDELEKQLEAVINSKDPVGYMQSNINWEIDKEWDDDNNDLRQLTNLLSKRVSSNKGYESLNPFRRFLNWFRRSRTVKKVKRILCSIADKIKELIDEEAELKTILGVALAAIAAAIGIGAINPLILTILVGVLATMILEGVSKVCGI